LKIFLLLNKFLKQNIMKMNIKSFIVGLSLVSLATSCSLLELDPVKEPNNPTAESVLKDATRTQIEQLGNGMMLVMRSGYADMASIAGSVGREIVIFAKTDNRYYTELQGQAAIDAAGIMYPWYTTYNQTRRRAELMTRSADNTAALSAAEKSAVKGAARTIQAYVMLNCLNMSGETGIRTTFTDLQSPGDLLKPGPFVTYSAGLTYIKQLVDEGAAELDKASAKFPFPMASGWANFDTPANFKKVNRAIAARVAMYQQDWAGMGTALNASFLDLKGSLATGPVFNYSTTSGDAVNPFFKPKEEANTPWAAQKDFVKDAEAGDTRVFGASRSDGGTAKVRKRAASVTLGGFPVSEYEMQIVATNVSSMSIIRNEELILMKAEADIQTGKLADAVAALDVVREAHGLRKLSVAKPTIVANKDALINELLNQRRYSLFMEGHRWFDMRRYARLASLPLDLPTHKVIDKFPKQQNEVDWDSNNK
jgi:starch-binding outer membrane protein, SusD/RagB family